jgi:hypothetical protein
MLPILGILFLLLLGFAVSIIANTLGIEGGIIFIPVLVLGLGLTAQEAAGVSLTTMIFGLGSGSLAYALQKRIDYKLSLLLGGSTIPGAILGAWTTQFVSSNVLKLLFGLTLIPLAIRMIMENKGNLENVKETRQGKWKRRLIDHDGKDFTYAVSIDRSIDSIRCVCSPIGYLNLFEGDLYEYVLNRVRTFRVY